MVVKITEVDWTVSREGRTNSSHRFEHLKKEIARLIQSDLGYALRPDHVENCAGLILAQLAHLHGVTVPQQSCPCGEEFK